MGEPGMNDGFAGKVAVVTRVAQGIGRAIAGKLHAHGARRPCGSADLSKKRGEEREQGVPLSTGRAGNIEQ